MELEQKKLFNGARMKLFKNFDFGKLKNGLTKTREKIANQISEAISGKALIDEEVLEKIEEILITSDINYDITEKIIESARKELKGSSRRTYEDIIDVIKKELEKQLTEYSTESEFVKIDKFKPFVILIVGVNGAGKTTTIGKLANLYKKAGLKVVVGAADTFRAAANEQLEVWAERVGVEIIQREKGSDPSSVAFETLTIAKRNNADVVIIDTAGRLHTKNNLMEELRKLQRVLKKVLDYAPNEVFLVVDGNTGQNALIQAREFSKYTELTGIVITKLDGTAKGGMIFSVCSELNTPVKYIGVGEGVEDLQTFEPSEYVKALFS